jgi:hypothetical protein
MVHKNNTENIISRKVNVVFRESPILYAARRQAQV